MPTHTGVTMSMKFASLCTLMVIIAGCGASEEQLRARAAFDLKCTESAIQVVEIDGRTRGVRGCNQQATYVETCSNSNHTDCTWVLNADTKKE